MFHYFSAFHGNFCCCLTQRFYTVHFHNFFHFCLLPIHFEPPFLNYFIGAYMCIYQMLMWTFSPYRLFKKVNYSACWCASVCIWVRHGKLTQFLESTFVILFRRQMHFFFFFINEFLCYDIIRISDNAFPKHRYLSNLSTEMSNFHVAWKWWCGRI